MQTTINSSMNTSLNESIDEVTDDDKSQSEMMGMSTFSTNAKATNDEKDLRDVYIKNYGVKMEIGSFYVYGAKIVPHCMDHVVQLGWHIIPKDFSQSVQTSYLDGRVEENDYAELYKNTGSSILIKL